MRFVEVVLHEPDKNVVAMADAYFFPPYQPILFRPKGKAGTFYPTPLQLPHRQARLVVYNKKTNETSIWLVELSEVHATARGGHHRGRVLSSVVVPDVQPPMVWYFETWHFAFVFVSVSWLVWSCATVAHVHMNQRPGPDVKRDHLQHDTTTLVPKPCSVNPFWVHIWARGYDQGEASVIHTNTNSWCRLSLSFETLEGWTSMCPCHSKVPTFLVDRCSMYPFSCVFALPLEMSRKVGSSIQVDYCGWTGPCSYGYCHHMCDFQTFNLF